ncbi:MAG: DNA repair protein RecO [Deltaproteobacteria bacterium]|nr:DNA repair protein RecO [Deltaproteobacteria bacterium]MBW2355524.1 DNA repair protein RecO [Deltaproteobacteria bacterium]RLB98040.1 MAG: DNA repair protein RecO [Deltaproteobacteria bacterium]
MKAEADFNTPAILLRRIEYGDHDLILSVITPDRGKLALMAKAAKRSRRRFGGVLDLFAILELSCRAGRRGRLPLLAEASLCESLGTLRTDVAKTAYASYWAELVHFWGEEGQPQPALYALLHDVLTALDLDRLPARVLSLHFQLRFMGLAGLGPRLGACVGCQRSVEEVGAARLGFDPVRGGVICRDCEPVPRLPVSRGAIKELAWVAGGDLVRVQRMRCSDEALRMGEALMETFVPFHLGREVRSLKFLRNLRESGALA